ncbi:hypothetical protein SLH46_15255 [Draconibacterium sp. IB214405]|uniref:hypothetical protein n=1 Tax=Draconibacterium sp. IB214405 TaxID=3097352 RepID=UPI002A0E09B3|nr:hypothetical protein [Draconibacterium sp. IB214405]MDX8340556.1 hypothetical protein [Draconibacterium sp. IB214405]
MKSLSEYWHIWIPLMIILVCSRFVYYIATHVTYGAVGVKDSLSNENNRYTTLFNVKFDFWTRSSLFLTGVIETEHELCRNDVLNILAFTKRKKLLNGYEEIRKQPASTSHYFKYEYSIHGEGYVIWYRKTADFELQEENVFADYW